MSTAGTVLAQAAMAAVTQVASQYVLEPDAEKRQAAFDIIKARTGQARHCSDR